MITEDQSSTVSFLMKALSSGTGNPHIAHLSHR